MGFKKKKISEIRTRPIQDAKPVEQTKFLADIEFFFLTPQKFNNK